MNSNSESTQPCGTRLRRSPVEINMPSEISSPDLSDLTVSTTTNRGVIEKGRCVANSPDYIPPTELAIHQSGNSASVTIQGPYNDVGRDQNNTYIGGKLCLVPFESISRSCIAATQRTIDRSVGCIVAVHALVRLY